MLLCGSKTVDVDRAFDIDGHALPGSSHRRSRSPVPIRVSCVHRLPVSALNFLLCGAAYRCWRTHSTRHSSRRRYGSLCDPRTVAQRSVHRSATSLSHADSRHAGRQMIRAVAPRMASRYSDLTAIHRHPPSQRVAVLRGGASLVIWRTQRSPCHAWRNADHTRRSRRRRSVQAPVAVRHRPRGSGCSRASPATTKAGINPITSTHADTPSRIRYSPLAKSRETAHPR